jgi:tellurite resistance protein TerC
MNHSLAGWIVFHIFILAMLILDLKVFHRKAHEIKIKEALGWTAFWIALGLAFNVGVYFSFGPKLGVEFLTAYLIEKSLSVDNIFVFVLIFTYFKVSPTYQHKILFWGIIGALFFRLTFILLGVSLIQAYHWVIYIFGVFLIYTGAKLVLEKETEIDPENNFALVWFKKFFPTTTKNEDGKFFLKEGGKWVATPLFIVLIVVETTDIVFAIDSIPAVLAITQDSFIAYTSNVFAILGLRALYFAISALMPLFKYLHYGLSAILVFVGLEMLLSVVYKLGPLPSLGVVVGILVVSIVASVFSRKETDKKLSDII